MLNILIVGIGGFTGSIARYLTALLVRMYLPLPFPLATLIVNVVGCFFIGAFYAYSERQTFHPQLWLLLTVGLCGGFTTFSAFGIETITLMKSGQIHLSLLNIAANLITGLAAVWLGQAVFLNR